MRVDSVFLTMMTEDDIGMNLYGKLNLCIIIMLINYKDKIII